MYTHSGSPVITQSNEFLEDCVSQLAYVDLDTAIYAKNTQISLTLLNDDKLEIPAHSKKKVTKKTLQDEIAHFLFLCKWRTGFRKITPVKISKQTNKNWCVSIM